MKLESGPYGKKKKRKKRLTPKQKQRRRIAGGIGGFLFLLLMWYGFQPVKGTIQFGVCRTFLELNTRYPQTLYFTSVEVFDKSLRMYYTYIDTFGSHRSEMMECDYRPFNMLNLEDVKRNRVSMDRRLIVAYNRTVPWVVHYRPNLALPGNPGNSLVGLKRDFKYNYQKD
jgi:hypothetical protein